MKNSDHGVADIIWLYRQKTVIFMHVIGMAIAFLMPIEKISEGTFIASVVDGVLNVVPMGKNFSVKSTIPELVRLQAAVMVFFMPSIIILYFSSPEFIETKKRMLKIMRASKKKLLLIHFLPILSLACFLNYLIFVEGAEFAIAPFLTSRFFLGALGPIMFCIVPCGMICSFFVTSNVIFKFWRGINV